MSQHQLVIHDSESYQPKHQLYFSGEVNNVTEEVNREVLFILPNNPPGPNNKTPTSTPSFEPLFKIICLHQLLVCLEITAAEILIFVR